MRLRQWLPIVTLLFVLPALAQEPLPVPVAPAPRTPELVRKVYNVADLVVPVPPANAAIAAGEHRKNTKALVRVVTGTVRPYTWDANGGAGRVDFDAAGQALVVQNTPAVVAEVGELIEALRRLQGPAITYEVQLVKARPAFCERVGLTSADTVLTEAQFRAILTAAQGERDAVVTQFPKMTACDGQSVTVRTGGERSFATGAEAVKVDGATRFVPKHTSIYLGDVLTLSGAAAPGDKGVHLRAQLTRTTLAGDVEQVPVVTRITPVFEGGSLGAPVPVTQVLQAPDVRTEKLDRTVAVPANGTVVLGRWKEPAVGADGNAPDRFEVVAVATVRVIRATDEPAGDELAVRKLRNVAAVDAAAAVSQHLQCKGVAAKLKFDVPSNSVFYCAPPAVSKEIADLLAGLDKALPQVVVQTMVIEVSGEFLAQIGIDTNGAGRGAWALTPREARMMTALIRAAKERGECEIVSRPQLQVRDGQSGHVRIGQEFPVQTAGAQVEHRPIGIALRVTPAVAPDGKSVALAAHLQQTTVSGSVKVGGTQATVFNSSELSERAVVPLGHTLVLTGGRRKTEARSLTGGVQRVSEETVQTIVLLVPAIVQSDAEVKPAAGWFTK